MDTNNKQLKKLNALLERVQDEAVKPLERLTQNFLGRFEYDSEILWKAQRKANMIRLAKFSKSKEEMLKYKADLAERLLTSKIAQSSTSATSNLAYTWDLECCQWMHSELSKIIENWE